MDSISKSNVLVVGAGGIGCELLKNLVMWNFKNITVVDLDTIDVSNLNRQFLFRKENVGKSKALVAKESVLKFNPNVHIDAKHDDIMNEKYNKAFFKSFDVVLNALDNKTARNHVNRMCLSVNVPLIEGGTMGYRGQVQVILKGKTACYECYPKPAQKQYPACTIRNTPSEPVHCIIWAKFLFNQLFGEPDVDQDVVPDQNDPELVEETEEENATLSTNGDGKHSNDKVNIRLAWKVGDQYDPSVLLKILFSDSISDLLTMKALWTKSNRVKPELLDNDSINANLDNIDHLLSNVTGGVKEQEHLTLYNWCQIFKKTSLELSNKIKADPSMILNWDKDDVLAMDFVAAASNIRMNVFHIFPMLNRFQIKSIAGNIIPAIATTNAMIAGVSVLHAYKVLQGQADKCLDVMVSDFVSARGKIVQAVEPLPPVADCYVCSSNIALIIGCRNLDRITVKDLKVEILQKRLKMLAPNVSVQNKSKIIIDGDEDDDSVDESYYQKTLDQFDIGHGTVLRCSDFLQNYDFNIELKISEDVNEPFEIIGDIDSVTSKAQGVMEKEENDKGEIKENGEQETSDDIILNDLVSEEQIVITEENQRGNRKRKHEDDNSIGNDIYAKISKMDAPVVPNESALQEENDDDDDLIIMD